MNFSQNLNLVSDNLVFIKHSAICVHFAGLD